MLQFQLNCRKWSSFWGTQQWNCRMTWGCLIFNTCVYIPAFTNLFYSFVCFWCREQMRVSGGGAGHLPRRLPKDPTSRFHTCQHSPPLLCQGSVWQRSVAEVTIGRFWAWVTKVVASILVFPLSWIPPSGRRSPPRRGEERRTAGRHQEWPWKQALQPGLSFCLCGSSQGCQLCCSITGDLHLEPTDADALWFLLQKLQKIAYNFCLKLPSFGVLCYIAWNISYMFRPFQFWSAYQFLS